MPAMRRALVAILLCLTCLALPASASAARGSAGKAERMVQRTIIDLNGVLRGARENLAEAADLPSIQSQDAAACQTEIAGTGNVYYAVTIDGEIRPGMWHTHKSPCSGLDRVLEQDDPSIHVYSEELDTWLRQLWHNTQDPECRAPLVDGVRRSGLPGGTTVRSSTAADRYDIDATAGVSTLTVDRR